MYNHGHVNQYSAIRTVTSTRLESYPGFVIWHYRIIGRQIPWPSQNTKLAAGSPRAKNMRASEQRRVLVGVFRGEYILYGMACRFPPGLSCKTAASGLNNSGTPIHDVYHILDTKKASHGILTDTSLAVRWPIDYLSAEQDALIPYVHADLVALFI